MGSYMMGIDQDKKEEGKLMKTTRDRYEVLFSNDKKLDIKFSL